MILNLEPVSDVNFAKDEPDYHSLNAEANLYGPDGKMQLDKDKEAARQYFLQHVNPNTYFFLNFEDRMKYLFEAGYYEQEVFNQYSMNFLKTLNDEIYAKNYRFASYMGAVKFFKAYALKTRDGKRYLEHFEDRVLANAVLLGDGNEKQARNIANAIMTGYQPATPTFTNAGKKARGGYSSCFLIRTEDNLESIMRSVASTGQLAKRGGGVGILGTNIRAAGDPIKGIENAASGVVPYGKVLDDTLAWINQLGTRQGAGVLYLNAHHMDVLALLDSKKENADDLTRLKILSVGLMIPDITYELTRTGEPMYLFSPHDVELAYGKPFSDISVTEHYRDMVDNPKIRKSKIDAREFFQRIAEVQAESGYPYIINEDTVNRGNPLEGRINMSNLCVEITQINTPSTFKTDGSYDEIGYDISCNLGSLLVGGAIRSRDFAGLIDASMRALTTVTLRAEFESVPSVEKANNAYHSVGLGSMGLHGFFMESGIAYDSPEAIDFMSAYSSAINFYSIQTSAKIAQERQERFLGFENSTYASGAYFTQYAEESFEPKTKKVQALFEQYGFHTPTQEEWAKLAKTVKKHGLFHSYRLANAPTGSISYVRDMTSSIHPITSLVESRQEGALGTVYYPAAGLTNENKNEYKDAYQIGWKPLIDLYAAAQKHVDQSQSMTLFFDEDATSKDVIKAIQYAYRSGVKSVYYARFKRNSAGIGAQDAELCVSCAV
jgi:ribonucleoside-diphosphate reductase alpha chain